ncbi:MAG: stage IV sporulation protein A [Clostridiaceae bacterium]|nr:stage IV sporulation protein A [Clostridiaceae bacterium]
MSKIYEDIAARTGGDIYIGVVGPVRTGKSTFIKRFMETMVIPRIDNVYRRERARDELPQSGSGKTIMTAEPKFVPEEAVGIDFGSTSLRVRLVDCVGYLIEGALGQTENDAPRMVTTPWFDHPVPMKEAAETGTRKVIAEHSTIGLVVTTDGSIADFPREAYAEAEERVIRELQALGKPFLVVVNSTEPQGAAALRLAQELRERYGVACETADCLTLDEAGVERLLGAVLREFPIREIRITLPAWAKPLVGDGGEVGASLAASLKEAASGIRKLWQAEDFAAALAGKPYIERAELASLGMGDGTARVAVTLPRSLYFDMIEEATGVRLTDEGALLPLLRELAATKRSYDKLAGALDQVSATGYGIVMPSIDEMTLEEPEIVRQGGKFGVRLRASAPSIHMLRADIRTEISPTVGSESQSEELLASLLKDFDGDPGRLWESNIFGKTLHELVNDGLNAKLMHMPEDARGKLQNTLERIINEGSAGLICIIL